MQLDLLVKADPINSELTYMQAQSLLALGQTDAAKAAYATVLARDPDSTYGLMAKAMLKARP